MPLFSYAQEITHCNTTFNIEGNNLFLENDVTSNVCANFGFHQQAMSEFGFEGWSNPNFCDIRRKGTRAMNALWLLHEAQTGVSSNILNWAWDYSKSRTDKFREDCSDTRNAEFDEIVLWDGLNSEIGGRITFFEGGLFGSSVVSRASLVLHEARHAQRQHDADCDESWLDDLTDNQNSCTKDSNWGRNGSYTYQALWLIWIAEASSLSDEYKIAAAQTANSIFRNNFVTHPGFEVEANTGDIQIVNMSPLSKLALPVRITQAPRLSSSPTDCSGHCLGQNLRIYQIEKWAGVDYYQIEKTSGTDLKNITSNSKTLKSESYRVRACYNRFEQCSFWSDGSTSSSFDYGRIEPTPAPTPEPTPTNCWVNGPYGRINVCG